MSNKELFIEICKKNIKRAGIDDLLRWLESSDFFEAPASTRYHGSKSVYLVQNFMKLSPEEAASINCHMGAFSDSNVGSSFEQFPLAWFLHIADGMATYVTENMKG